MWQRFLLLLSATSSLLSWSLPSCVSAEPYQSFLVEPGHSDSEGFQALLKALEEGTPVNLTLDTQGWHIEIDGKPGNPLKVMELLGAMLDLEHSDKQLAAAINSYGEAQERVYYANPNFQLQIRKARAAMMGISPTVFDQFPGFEAFVNSNEIYLDLLRNGHRLVIENGSLKFDMPSGKVSWESIKQNIPLDANGNMLGFAYTVTGFVPLKDEIESSDLPKGEENNPQNPAEDAEKEELVQQRLQQLQEMHQQIEQLKAQLQQLKYSPEQQALQMEINQQETLYQQQLDQNRPLRQ